MQIDKNLYDEINEYCKLNSLKTRDFIHNLLRDAFMKEKYGDSPFAFNKNDSQKKVENKKVMEDVQKDYNQENILNKTVETPVLKPDNIETSQNEIRGIPQTLDNETIIPTIQINQVSKPKKKRTLN